MNYLFRMGMLGCLVAVLAGAAPVRCRVTAHDPTTGKAYHTKWMACPAAYSLGKISNSPVHRQRMWWLFWKRSK